MLAEAPRAGSGARGQYVSPLAKFNKKPSAVGARGTSNASGGSGYGYKKPVAASPTFQRKPSPVNLGTNRSRENSLNRSGPQNNRFYSPVNRGASDRQPLSGRRASPTLSNNSQT